MKEAEQLKITAINLRSILSESQSDLRNTVKKRKFVKYHTDTLFQRQFELIVLQIILIA